MKSRGVDPFDRRSMALSAGMHAALLAIAWLSTLVAPEQIAFATVEVELVSPPPAVEAQQPQPRTEEVRVEVPEPEPAPPEPEPTEVVPAEEPEPEPEPPPPEPEQPVEEPEAEEETRIAQAPEEVEEEPEVSGEGINVRIEGLQRDYPEYYSNIIRQIFRCFRWRDGGRWETTVLFWITRDGTAVATEFEQRSGNTRFDLEAMGAIECAGSGRFGPLPEDLPYERIPIRFRFQPSGALELEAPHRAYRGE